MNENRKDVGARGESLALGYLAQKGFRLKKRNYRFQRGEIDLIMESPEGDLVFVEVKASRQKITGHPLEWITPNKQRQIQKVAQGFCFQNPGLRDRSMRFDVVGIELHPTSMNEYESIQHIPNAFLPDLAHYSR